MNSSGVERFRPVAFWGSSLEQETSLKTRSERHWWENKRKRNLPEQLYYSRQISPALGAESFPVHEICFGKRTNTEHRSDILQGASVLPARVPRSWQLWSRWILVAAALPLPAPKDTAQNCPESFYWWPELSSPSPNPGQGVPHTNTSPFYGSADWNHSFRRPFLYFPKFPWGGSWDLVRSFNLWCVYCPQCRICLH